MHGYGIAKPMFASAQLIARTDGRTNERSQDIDLSSPEPYAADALNDVDSGLKARIVGRRMHWRWRKNRPIADPWMHWYARITQHGIVLWSDDCRSLPELHELASRKVLEFRLRDARGEKFKPWSQLVDEARI